jgi:creatinine amidohydrolase/Fe(II)-dependent formamide hydrolase-like protein
MRFEELTTGDLRQASAACDTVVLGIGGLGWRPPHLPIGSTWYILRRLRDDVETAYAGRVLTCPVLPFSPATDPDGVIRLSEQALTDALTALLHGLLQFISPRHAIALTDNEEAERAFTAACARAGAAMQAQVFVWWRDGISTVDPGYAPGGVLETSAIQHIAPRLVHLQHPSARRHGAQAAAATAGEQLLESVTRALRAQLESAWARHALTDDH